MKLINSVLMAGAGAIGLSFAETIYKADPDCISILAYGERRERYQKTGLRVNGEKLDIRLSFGEKADLIIVASKSYHLDQIIEDIRPSVGENTIILSLLNGITSEAIIGGKLGRGHLPLAMVLATDASHNAGETKYTRKGVIHFGDGEGKNGERENIIADFFTRTGVPFKLEDNMKRALWYKFMINTAFNQNTAVLRLPHKAIMDNGAPGEIPEARRLVEKTMREVIAVANAEGIDLDESDIENWRQNVCRGYNPEAFTSMCQDVIAGRQTEVDLFSPVVMELAKKHGINVPLNETLYLQLRTIEARRKFLI